MVLKKHQQIFDLLLLFFFFFLSNASAFFYVVWIVPEIVFIGMLIWILLTAICVWIMHTHGLIPKFLENVKKIWFLFPFLIFSAFSIFWSVYWEVSLYRWITFLCVIIAGGYIGLRYDIKKILNFLSVFGIYILLLSSIVIFFLPNIGIQNYYIIQGAWKGIFWHKNHMGLMATFINTLFFINIIYILQSGTKNILSWGLLYLFSLFFVYQTDSVAAYFTVILLHGIILFALIWLKVRENLSKLHYLIFLAVLVLTSLAVLLNLDLLFGVFNRSPTLTGRVPMWSYLFEAYLSERQLEGYGFNAFWYIESYRVDIGLAAGYPDQIVIADNGFIDILMNTGYIGLALFLFFYFGAWWLSIKHVNRARDIYEFFPIVLMSYILIANVSWSLIFENESFFMLMMISVLFSISRYTQIKNDPNQDKNKR